MHLLLNTPHPEPSIALVIVFLMQFLAAVVPSVTQCSKQTPLQDVLHFLPSFVAFQRSTLGVSAGLAMASGSGTGAAAGMALALADRVRARRVTMDWICMVVEILEGWSGWMSVLGGKGLEEVYLRRKR